MQSVRPRSAVGALAPETAHPPSSALSSLRAATRSLTKESRGASSSSSNVHVVPGTYFGSAPAAILRRPRMAINAGPIGTMSAQGALTFQTHSLEQNCQGEFRRTELSPATAETHQPPCSRAPQTCHPTAYVQMGARTGLHTKLLRNTNTCNLVAAAISPLCKQADTKFLNGCENLVRSVSSP